MLRNRPLTGTRERTMAVPKSGPRHDGQRFCQNSGTDVAGAQECFASIDTASIYVVVLREDVYLPCGACPLPKTAARTNRIATIRENRFMASCSFSPSHPIRPRIQVR